MKFPGFEKTNPEGSDAVHLSANGWRTACGLAISGDWLLHREVGEDSSIGENQHLCKNCRASILKRAGEKYDKELK